MKIHLTLALMVLSNRCQILGASLATVRLSAFARELGLCRIFKIELMAFAKLASMFL